MNGSEALPVTLHFEGGRTVHGAVTREGGGRWRMVCAAYPSHVATGTNIVKVRQDLEKRLAPLVAQDAAFERARRPVRVLGIARQTARERARKAYEEARWLLT